MADGQRGHGCLRAGCFGCGGLMLVIVLIIAGTGLVGYANRPGPVDMREDARTLVEAVGPVGTTEGEGVGATALVTRTARKPGLLRLEFDAGTLDLRPAPAGSELRVEGSYDDASHELTTETETLPNGTWSTRIRFHPRGGLFRLMFGGERPQPRLTVHVPRDLPLTLRADVSTGDSRLELGGLTLEAVFVQASMGSHAVAFSEPTVTALSSFQLKGQMGELSVEKLGNASPARAELEHSLGEVRLDLDGAWRNGSEVKLHFRLGAAVVTASDDVPLEVVNAVVKGRGKVVRTPGFGTTEAEPGSRVRLDAEGSMGELQLGR